MKEEIKRNQSLVTFPFFFFFPRLVPFIRKAFRFIDSLPETSLSVISVARLFRPWRLSHGSLAPHQESTPSQSQQAILFSKWCCQTDLCHPRPLEAFFLSFVVRSSFAFSCFLASFFPFSSFFHFFFLSSFFLSPFFFSLLPPLLCLFFLFLFFCLRR